MQTLDTPRKPVHSKCMGIEIECLIPRHTAEAGKHYGFFYAGVDGSLRPGAFSGRKGIEFVSQPLPYQWLRKEIVKLAKQFPWTTNESCGIHVHVSRSWTSPKRIAKLCAALRKYHPHEMVELFGRYSEDYATTYQSGISRYGAVNTTNRHTVEFRMWAPGDAQWALECLRRTKLMVEHKGAFTPEALMELFTRPEK